MVASGQRAGRNRKTQAHIRIWSTETLLTLYVFGMGEFEIGVSAVAFSQLVSQAHKLRQKFQLLELNKQFTDFELNPPPPKET
jgi:hypothetical protein